ncbi:MAG: ATP-binding cassette domain-containing protein, partial [Promethearchaeota archaeon]
MIKTRENDIIEQNKVVIDVRNLKKYYNGIKAVDGISFKIYQGECFGFLGPNGAGKTTTINLLSCYLKPDSGEIFIMDLDVKKEPSKVKQFLGIVPQEN